ncbi:MAG: VOC family protein [Myxococcota bacterium]
MLSGAHVIVYSKDADKDRAFFSDVLKLSSVDVGGGWLIFGLPPSELAVHPAKKGGSHELYLMCDSIEAFASEMDAQGIPISAVQDQGWGLVAQITLPSGSKLSVYEPRHARPEAATTSAKPRAKKAAKKTAKRARTASTASKKKPSAKKAPKAKSRARR